MKKTIIIIAILVLAGFGVWFLKGSDVKIENVPEEIEDTDEVVNNETGSASISVGVGESKSVLGMTITPLLLSEDSRCASDVVCIWAGTVKVMLQTESPTAETNVIELGQSIKVGNTNVTFVSAEPYPKVAGEKISPTNYNFVFGVSR